jgi:hypothetical protein
MCKKLVLAVGAVIVGLAVISFTGVGALAHSKWKAAQKWMDSQVPVEAKLDQLKSKADKIDKDIQDTLKKKLAPMEVEADRLESNLNALKEQQTKLHDEVAAMTAALENKGTKVSYNNKTYGVAEFTERLDSAVSKYERQKVEIKTREQLLASKRQALELAHERITEMRGQKDKIRIAIAQLETRIESAKLQQVSTDVSMDDSVIAECNALVDQIDMQLAQTEKFTQLQKQYGYEPKSKSVVARQEKNKEDVLQAAKKALEGDSEKVSIDNVDKK